MSIDLKKLENKLDEALSNETNETLTKFLTNKRMSNNKQSSVEWLVEQIKKDINLRLRGFDIDKALEQAKEKYEHEMCVFADEYASYVLEQSKHEIKGAMVPMCPWTFFKNRRNEQQ